MLGRRAEGDSERKTTLDRSPGACRCTTHSWLARTPTLTHRQHTPVYRQRERQGEGGWGGERFHHWVTHCYTAPGLQLRGRSLVKLVTLWPKPGTGVPTFMQRACTHAICPQAPRRERWKRASPLCRGTGTTDTHLWVLCGRASASGARRAHTHTRPRARTHNRSFKFLRLETTQEACWCSAQTCKSNAHLVYSPDRGS